jgi:hypothetical protein
VQRRIVVVGVLIRAYPDLKMQPTPFTRHRSGVPHCRFIDIGINPHVENAAIIQHEPDAV